MQAAHSLLANADARLWLLQQLRPEERNGLCERSLSSDSVELTFSLLAGLCVYKPAMQVAVGALNRVEFRNAVRNTPREERVIWMDRDAQPEAGSAAAERLNMLDTSSSTLATGTRVQHVTLRLRQQRRATSILRGVRAQQHAASTRRSGTSTRSDC